MRAVNAKVTRALTERGRSVELRDLDKISAGVVKDRFDPPIRLCRLTLKLYASISQGVEFLLDIIYAENNDWNAGIIDSFEILV